MPSPAALALALWLSFLLHPAAAALYPFNDPTLPPSARAADLLSRLTLPEKIGMLYMSSTMAFGNDSLPVNGDLPSTAVPRLGVPQFNWMSGGSHYRGAPNGCVLGCCTACPAPASGCCHDGAATQLPQGTGVAATFNPQLVFALGALVGDESRGLQNGVAPRLVDYRTGASSVINVMRHGLWGRAPETYGECPLLTAEIALALNKGLIGFAALAGAPPPAYAKVLPVLRHFVAYAGPDSGRFGFDARVAEADLHYTYLPAWRRLSAEGALLGVMSAISSLNSIPSAAHAALLSGVLRSAWGYRGFVISDCDTIAAASQSFHLTASVEQAAVAALRAGGDLNCGPEYALLLNATQDGLLSEAADVDPAVQRLLEARVRTGALNPGQSDPYAALNLSDVDTPAHRALARAAVAESCVLLCNGGGALPLGGRGAPAGAPSAPLRNLLVVGPSADDAAVQAHTYHGTPWRWTTVLLGLREALNASGVNVTHVAGCSREGSDRSGFGAALALAAGWADAVLFVGGLQASMEEEDTDRADFLLPGVQAELVRALAGAAAGATASRGGVVPCVTLIVSGGPVAEPTLLDSALPGSTALMCVGGGAARVPAACAALPTPPPPPLP